MADNSENAEYAHIYASFTKRKTSPEKGSGLKSKERGGIVVYDARIAAYDTNLRVKAIEGRWGIKTGI